MPELAAKAAECRQYIETVLFVPQMSLIYDYRSSLEREHQFDHLPTPEEIAQLHYGPGDLDKELLVDPPYDDIYELYLEAEIDRANGEYNKYQNTMQSYNARRGDFVTWFCQIWDPAQGSRKERPRRYGTV